MNTTSLEMEGVQMEEKDKGWYCLLCSTSLAPELGQDGVLLETARCSMSDRAISDVLASVLGTLELLFQHVCTQCFQLLDIIDKIELQLKLKKGEVQNLYFSSGKPFQEALCLAPTPVQSTKVPDSAQGHELENLHMESFIDQSHFAENPPEGEIVTEKTQEAELFKESLQKSQQVEVAEPPKKKDKGLLTSTDLKCQICKKTFEKRRYLMDHLRRVHNSAIHKCAGCETRFKYREEMVTHQAQCQPVTQIRSIERENVPEDLPQKKPLPRRRKNNQCIQCDRYFLTQALLLKHQRIHHMGDSSEDKVEEEEDETKAEAPVCCPLCKIVINNDYALAIHQGSVHGVERPWECKLCGKNFARHLELDNHRRVHSGEKPFQCDVCGARFNQKQNLHTHVRHIHLGERRYSCSDCGAKFRRKRLLDCHVNSKHKGEKPYSCSLCPATFVYPEHVKKHEQTHSAEKLHCPDCSKTFKSKTSLENHKSVHKPSSHYQCLSCPMFYLSREELLEHLRASGHPKGVFSTASRGLEVPVEQETLTLSFMEEEEEDRAPGGFQDVVLYLSDGLCYTEAGQPVYVAQEEEQEEEVVGRTEVQSAILSIVETGTDTSS